VTGKRASGQTGKEFSIEEVRELDAAWPELRSLFLELEAYHAPWVSRTLRDDWHERWRDHIAPTDDRLILIARDGDSAVGYLNVWIRRDFGIFKELIGFIEDAYVKEDSRNHGIGSAMLARAEAWCRSRGAVEARLTVAASNELGLGFWTRAGFRADFYQMTKPLTRVTP
jgi:ribosomal protein S18 acetylase RimI-like enzyme